MSRTPAAHWVPETLRRRVPYTDKPFQEQHDPYEISLGNGHREISHLLEIIYDQQASKVAKTKALRLLKDLLPGREAEAIQLSGFEALKPLLMQPPNGLLLHSMICLDQLIDTMYHAEKMLEDVPRIVDVLDPENEPPLRIAAAGLLRHIAELVGPAKEFTTGEIPIKIVEAAASPLSTEPLLFELFDLLAKLTNVQTVRVPLIENRALLEVLVKSIKNPKLRQRAINMAENIAMDSSHNGKIALLEADILDEMAEVLDMKEVSIRQAAISLVSLLAVPKEGKERIAMARDIADALKRISESDADLHCRRAAYKARVIVAELPFGKVIVGEVVDPSKPVRKETSEEQEKEVTRANPQIGQAPVTYLLSPRSAGSKLIVKPKPGSRPQSPTESTTPRMHLPDLAPEVAPLPPEEPVEDRQSNEDRGVGTA